MSLETQHRIVEAIEIVGADPVTKAFLKLAGASEAVAKALGEAKLEGQELDKNFDELERNWFSKPDKVTKPPKKGATAWEKFKKAAGEATGPIFRQITLANLLEKAVGFVITKLTQMVQKGWAINEAFEAARSRVQGMSLGLVDWGDDSPAEQLVKSQKLANVLMREFRDIGMETGTLVPEIEAAYARLNSILSLTGASQYDIVQETKLAAGAAKVYGEKAEQAAGIVAKAIFEGTVEGETAFARALKASAGVTSKMTQEERFKRVNKVLEKMAGATSAVTANTAGAMARWEILSTDILQRITLPIYERIGQMVQGIVDAFTANEDVIDSIVTETQAWWETIWGVSKGVWDITVGALQFASKMNGWVEKGQLLWNVLGFVRQTVELIGLGFQAGVELVRTLIDPNRGMGKLNTLSEGIKLKWFEIADQILKVVDSLAKLVVPEFMRDMPGIKQFFKGISDVRFGLGLQMDSKAKKLRALEEKWGTGPLTDSTRAAKRIEEGIGLDKAAREALLRGTKGIKVEQKIDTINIMQDFRDDDPDHVIVEFVGALERIGENALQSTVGGAATAFEGGSSQ